MDTIAVIDYGMGNLRSVAKALEQVADKDARVIVTADPGQLTRADRVVFPGQGAARDCMKELQALGLVESVQTAAQNKPFLGICMGMQILADSSDEDAGVACLGIVPGQVRSLRAAQHNLPGSPRYKLPHMGWNQLSQTNKHALWEDIPQNAHFYFVHSFYFEPADPGCVAAVSDYGLEFTAAISRENLFAIQCHPEKSARHGLALLSNFVRWKP